MLATLLGAASAEALVIDSFETGPFQLASTGEEAETTQTSLDPEEVASGGRRVVLLAFPAGTAVLDTGTGDDALVVEAGISADLVLGYAPAEPVPLDFTDGGTADRLRIAIRSTTHPLELRGSLTAGRIPLTTRSFVLAAPGPGVYEVHFGDLGFPSPADLASVYSFTFVVFPQVSAPGGSSYTVEDLRTVPEPGAGAAATGATVLAWLRRRQRGRASRVPSAG